MKLSFKPLLKSLVDKEMKLTALRDQVPFSERAYRAIKADQPISLAVILDICNYLDCQISEIVEVIPGDQKKSPRQKSGA